MSPVDVTAAIVDDVVGPVKRVIVHLNQPSPTDVIVAVAPAATVPTAPVSKLNQQLADVEE